MRRLLALIFWLAIFLSAGFLAGEWGTHWATARRHLWPAMAAHAGAAGAVAMAALCLLLALLGWLPGIRPRGAARPVKFGPAQAVWLLLGFIGMEIAGLLGFLILANIVRLLLIVATHKPPLFDAASPGADILAVLCGMLAAGFWCAWYVGRRGPARLRDPGPSGIAWRPAPRAGYAMAFLAAIALIAVVMTLFHFLPPDMMKLEDLPDARLYAVPGWPADGIVLLAVLIAPPVEEFVFRGGMFAALASRFSPLTAGALTTLAFMAVHAPEKIHYPPGFIDVGLMGAIAAWMRVRFGSIRPGMLLHALYNAGLLVAVGYVR